MEGELGTIGQTDSEAEDGSERHHLHNPDDALAFVESTPVDSLAVAIGAHGIYPKAMNRSSSLTCSSRSRTR